MLELHVYDSGREIPLEFEHSLLSVSKWEEIHKKPFLTAERSAQEMVEYYRCMLLSPGVSSDLVYRLTPEQLIDLEKYVNDSRTASSVPSDGSMPSREVVTSELVYYWMVEFKIPFHPAETWHLSRLMMLVQMTAFKKKPPAKQRPGDFMSKFRDANAAAKKRFNSNG